jgi:hypothetical protein
MAEVQTPAPRSKSLAEKLHLSPWVYYDQFDPRYGTDQSRGSLAELDYSPLRRITGKSLIMGVLVSMGGFLYVLCHSTMRTYSKTSQLWLRHWPDLRLPSHARFPGTFWSTPR